MNIAHSSSAGVQVTSHGSANTKGNYAQGIATTAVDADGFQGFMYNTAAANRTYMFDIAIGGVGAEVVLVPNITIRNLSTSSFTPFYIPCHVPAGSRVSFRCQDDTGGGSMRIAGFLVPSTATGQVGFSTSAKFINPLAGVGGTSLGHVSVDAGGTANTFSGTTGNICNADAPIAATHLLVWTRDINSAVVDYLIRVDVNGSVVTPEFYHRGTNGAGETIFHRLVKLDTPIAINDTVTAEVSCSGNTVGSRELRVSVALIELPAASSSGGFTLSGAGMQRALKDGETTASRKAIELDVRTAAGAIYNANGETARIRTASGSWTDATNTVVGTADGNELTLTDAEAAAAAPGDLIRVYVPASVNHLASPKAIYEVTADDVAGAALTKQEIADEVNRRVIAILRTLKRTGTNGNGGLALTGPDGAETTVLATGADVEPILEFDTAS